MSFKKGFTLIEIIVVLVIISILAMVTFPNYNTMIMQGEAKSAENNLITIYNAENSYFFNSNAFCINSTTNTANKGIDSGLNANCADTTPDINTNLSLNITDSNFSYACNPDPSGFQCVATNNSDPNFTITLFNTPIIYSGGNGTPNPNCADTANPSYCPT